MSERGATRGGGLEERRVWIERGGGSSAVAIPLEDVPSGREVAELSIDR